MESRLDELKDLAHAEREGDQAKAQLKIGDHLFAVAGHGRGRFRYVLTDERFFIQISKGKTLPLAYAQIASAYLTAAGIEAATADLRYVVNSLGRVDGSERLSRVDPCVDLVPGIPVEGWDVRQWVTRGRNKAAYWSGEKFSGWRIAAGGAIQSRFYDKVLEVVEQSHKTYLFALWSEAGWQTDQPVWRQEFQVGREALKELRIGTVADLGQNLGALWAYLTGEWLRLAELSDDSNRSRWANHPLWMAIASVDWSQLPQPTLKRVRSSTLPRDEQIFTAIPGYIASFMAREGITDWSEGLGETLRQAETFHRLQGQSLERYVERKARAKGRIFATIDNVAPDAARDIAEAEAYRKAKDGE